jgi:phage terminase large subunit
MKIVFDTKGNEKQKECARAWVDDSITEIVYGGSKGSAKSFTGCSLIFGDALIYPNTQYFIARKNLNDLRKFTLPSIYEVMEKMDVNSEMFKYDGKDNFFTLYNQSKVFLLECRYLPSDPIFERFGSMQMTRGWIEEAGQITFNAKQNIHASIGRWKNDDYNLVGKLLMTCNPSKNFLYKEYYKPNKEGTLNKSSKFIQALPSDNKMLSRGYLENLEKILSNNEKERLLKGNWEYDDNPFALCDYESIISIFENRHVIKTGVKYITADVARYGSDRAVIFVWDGWVVIECITFDISSTTDLQNAINSLRTKHNIPANRCIADDDGVGGGVVDNCKILGFVNNSKAIDEPIQLGVAVKPNFKNLQAQCVFYFAQTVNDYGIFIECDMQEKFKEFIIEEIETIERKESEGTGTIEIMGKDSVKDKIGRSPDFRDALMMRKYFDLKPPLKSPKYSF